jgi:cytochrome b561
MSIAADRDERGLGGDVGSSLPRYTMRNYRLPAKVFHWVSAVLVMFMVTSGLVMTQLGEGPWADTVFSLHKTTGVIALAVVLLRLCYRVFWPDPAAHGEGYRRPILHWMLYVALVLMPLLGWAGVSAFGSRGILFGLELPAIWPEGSAYADLLLQVHAYLAFGLLALVALHVGVAIQDHMLRARDTED